LRLASARDNNRALVAVDNSNKFFLLGQCPLVLNSLALLAVFLEPRVALRQSLVGVSVEESP
jgi:hypothetical protein